MSVGFAQRKQVGTQQSAGAWPALGLGRPVRGATPEWLFRFRATQACSISQHQSHDRL